MKNLLATTGSKVKHTTMFEVNDENRKHENNGDHYAKPFISFLKSLDVNLEVEKSAEHYSEKNVEINGVEFWIYTDNCSFTAWHPYGREYRNRAESNRFISLKTSGYGGTTVIKIFFNKEYEVSKLVAKISAAIKANNDKETAHANKVQQDEINLNAIGNHYMINPVIKEHIRYIHIEKGVISFSFFHGMVTRLNADGSWNSANFYVKAIATPDDLIGFSKSVGKVAEIFEETSDNIRFTEPISDELQAWCQGRYHDYFYSETLLSTTPNS